MPNLTSNFNYNKPLVNDATDADLWGGQLNTNWDNIDTNLSQTTAVKLATFSVLSTEFNFTYLVDSSAGSVTIDLPAAPFNGFVVRFKLTDTTNTITLDGNGSETIDGDTTKVITSTTAIVCDGTNWQITNEGVSSGSTASGGLLIADGSGGASFELLGQTSATQTSSQSIPNGAWTALEWDSEDYDDLTWHDNVTNNTRVTPDSTGRYDIGVTFQTTDSNNGDVGVAIYVNGTEVRKSLVDTGGTTDGRGLSMVALAYPITASDYVEGFAFLRGGSSAVTDIDICNLTVKRVR